MSGTVFNDFNQNGAIDGAGTNRLAEPGIAGVQVVAYDAAGTKFGPATTNASGQYSLAVPTASSASLRLEVIPPTGYYGSRAGTDNATTIRFLDFTSGVNATNQNFALEAPGEYCENNPTLCTTVFPWSPTGAANISRLNSTGLVSFPYSNTESLDQTTAPTVLTSGQSTGALYGLAHDPVTDTVYGSSYLRRKAPFANDSTSTIYRRTSAGTFSAYVDLSVLFYGSANNAASAGGANPHPLASTDWLQDQGSADYIGKRGLGDLDISTDGLYLYSVGLNDKKFYIVPTTATPTTANTKRIDIVTGAIGACPAADIEPFGIGVAPDGSVLVGGVCTAASTLNNNNLKYYIWQLNAAQTAFTLISTLDVDNTASLDQSNLNNTTRAAKIARWNAWAPWNENWATQNRANGTGLGTNDGREVFPQPMLSDIEFDGTSLILGVRDRYGDQAPGNFRPGDFGNGGAGGTGSEPYPRGQGDVLKACLVGGNYVMEGNGVAGCDAGSDGEYFADDHASDYWTESSLGGLAVLASKPGILSTSYDPRGYAGNPAHEVDNVYDENGVLDLRKAGSTDGQANLGNYAVYRNSDTAGHFWAKANGLGDLEALCDAAPLEIGNRVWRDTDHDGIQDPGEAGIDGVHVSLYAAADTSFSTPLGTATTSGGGQYYFTTETARASASTTDNVGGGLAYRQGYVIRIGNAADYQAGGALAGLELTVPNATISPEAYTGQSDLIDSDPVAGAGVIGSGYFPTIAVAASSTNPGQNNHSYDAGFTAALPYDLALRKTVLSMNGAPSSGTVTFQLEVFNQTAAAVNGVTITDYIDANSFQPMGSASSGTTGGAAALPYAWDVTDPNNPTVTISGVIPGNSSVTLPVTLAIKQPVHMAGLLNTAEITRFDNDGNPANGDSSTGAVYDVDSIPDAVNNDALVDDEISLHRWTNTATTQTQNTGVSDEDDHDIATVPLYDLALIKTRAAGQDAIITSPSSTANFDITVKNQGQTRVYNATVLDSPTSPLARSASTPASQNVTTTLGASVTVTYNAATGVFTIPTLAPGDQVTFRVVADLASVNTVQVNTAEITSFDNDNNPSNAKPSWVQDVDSTPDTNPLNDAREIFAGSTFPEDSHNQIDRAPVNGVNAADEDDHDSEAVELGLLRLGSTVYKDLNGNDVGDAGEEVPGVLVQLFRNDGGSWTLVGETVTNAGGDYSFDRLFPGTYQVGIPASQTHGSLTGINPTALSEWEPVPGSVALPEANNFDNDGDAEAGFLSRSDDVVLTFNGEPTNDTADNADADLLTAPRTYTDANSNLNIDFVFEPVTYELGNLVWADGGAGSHYDNGIADADESGLAGVTVQLYRDNGAGGAVAGDGVLAASELVATTTTDANGFYTFKGLASGTDYHAVVVKSSVPNGYDVAGTPVTVASADGVDNDNNAAIDTGLGWDSGAIALGPVATAEPTGETDGTTGTTAQPAASVADNRADQTVDFGFVPSVRIGNQVWRDESDNDPTTQVATDNDGIFNGSEIGLAGVTVQLWSDVNTNGTFERTGGDAAGLVQTTVTDSEGNYWFDGVRPGQPYFVVIPSIGSVSLTRPASSDGQSASVTAADNDDDGAPVGSDIAVSRAFTPQLGSTSLGEQDARPAGDGSAETEANTRIGGAAYDDNDSELRVDFGFVNVPVYRLGNLVWLDNGGSPYVAADEADGQADPNEPGIAGVEVQLFWANASDFSTPIATAVTDANGEYAFENLVGGAYRVRIPSTGANATTLAGLTSTVDGASADADVDNDDNGVVGSGAWLSSTVTLAAANAYMGGEPINEARRAGEAGTYDDGASWTTDPTDPATYANNRSNLTVDFGFAAVYRLGNLVWRDLDNDGVADAGEPGIPGVSVELLNASTGAVLDTTVTDADGHYVFTSLPAGTYAVRVVEGSLPAGLVASGTPVGDANNDVDNDTNAATLTAPLGRYTATVTLGGAEPTSETLRDGVATDDDNDSFADASSNYTVDFGFWPQMRLGNVVWIDQQDADPATYAATDNNGMVDAGETLLAGVSVEVWHDGGNGSVDGGVAGGDDTFAGSDTTDAEGNWYVDHLAPGTYFAVIETLPAPYADYVSSLGWSTSNNNLDNRDDGRAGTDGAGNPYVAVGDAITLTSGGETTGEVDSLPAGDGSAETEANAATSQVRDADSNLTVDFSFVSPPTYRVGNLVWLDSNRNGQADAGEPGISGVLVQLLNQAGTVINETLTDAQGHYEFTTDSVGTPLEAGSYRIRIPQVQTPTLVTALVPTSGALDNLSITSYAGDPNAVVADNDSNGQSVASAWQTPLVVLGTDPTTFESEPTIETLRAGVATDDDLGWPAGTDARSEFTVDFGFFPGLRLGDTVWYDDGRTGAGTYDESLENDGIYQATELPAPGVSVELFADNGDGVFNPGAGQDGTPVQTAVTDADGEYLFLGLDENTHYWVAIPASEQASGNELEGYRASVPVVGDGAGTNDHNHGTAQSGWASVSPLVTLSRGGLTYGDGPDEAGADAKSGVTLTDGESNLVIDFGFSPAPMYQLGNLVWLDTNDNGMVDAGESGIPGVSVALYLDNGDGVFTAGVGGDGTPIATDVTGADGRYEFTDLAAGTYFVRVGQQSALDGLDSSQVREANANNDVDNDNNAWPVTGSLADGWVSGAVDLGAVNGAGENDEPTAEADGNTSLTAEDGAVFDSRSNQTVDFGFAQRARIGNQVWRDESDADASTHVSTDNDGIFNGTERGLTGVTVQLWRDVDGDGVELGDDDVLVATTTTDGEGNYTFTNLIPGTDFYVAIPSVGSPFTTARSSAGQSATPGTADNDDDGAPLGSAIAVSATFDVTIGGAPTGEQDAIEPGDGVGVVDATAEIEANAASGPIADANSYLDVDFGFVEVPTYRIGNQVWLDANNDGHADAGEAPIAGVLVQLLNAGGDVIAETVTDASGHYAFENLVAGDYSVRIPSSQTQTLGLGLTIDTTALSDLASSTTDAANANDDVDNDDNGVSVAAGWQSGTVTLGAGPDAGTETEPTTEVSRDGGDDDTGWAGGTDARSNVTVDFGFYQLLRLGDIVWLDNGGSGASFVPTNEDDGEFDAASETTIDGVELWLWRDGGDGTFDGGAGDDTYVGTTTTSGGTYYFTGLTEGNYFVSISDTELGLGQPLNGLRSSTGRAADDSVNDLDQGEPVTGWAAVSQLVTLDAGHMSNGDTAFESRADARTGQTVADASSNLAIDFGFSPVPTYALGNLVWEDLNDNGVADLGEPGIGGVGVELYRDEDGSGTVNAGDTLVASTTTTASGADTGRYRFEGLAAGDYLVHVPSQATLTGWYVGGTPVANADAGVDNDNNAVADGSNGGWTSGAVTLGGAAGPADHAEPTAERDGIDNVDAELLIATRDDRSNQTVDFGFWRGLRLGNQVWLDEGAGDHQDNGVYDADEAAVTGLDVQLWQDNGDHAFDPATDSLVDTDTTDANGRYFFEHLAEGDYFVAIPSVSSGTRSSTGTVGTGLADDGKDDGDPVGAYASVSGELSLALGGAPTGETDGPGATSDDAEAYANGITGAYPDASSYLTADFGLIGVPTYRLGNLVWFDANNDGSAQTGEPGIDGVLVQLTNAAGDVLAETVTAGGGRYEFTGLAEGDYRVVVPSSQVPVIDGSLTASIVPDALDGFLASSVVDGNADNHEDNDANGVVVTGGARSGVITLGGAEPVTETVRVDDATDDDLGQASPRIDDDRSDYTIDFGYYSISLGNQVFRDVNGNGVFEPADGDAGIDGVTVYLRNASGAIVDTATTAGGGLYLFTGLTQGEQYYTEIPADQFEATGALHRLFSSPGDAGAVAADDTDGLDRGVDPAGPYGAVRSSGLVTASASASPVTDGEGDNPDNDAIRPDAAENLVLDFGFYAMELGGTVFEDPNNDGLDASDGDFADVTVLLYHGDGTPFLRQDGSQASTQTDANGDYRFTGLPEGEYLTEIPAAEFTEELEGWANSDGNDPVPSADNDVTGEDNGFSVSGDIFDGGAVRSTNVTLAVDTEPTDDPTPSADYADAMSNLSVDFGFWHAQVNLELGNQLWFDTERNGVFDATETAVPEGVILELRDADTDALIDSTVTDVNGRYLFSGLVPGRYVVLVTAENFLPGHALAGYTSTDGTGRSTDPNDANDSDSNALPLSATGVRSGEVTLLASTPTGEVDAASAGLDDRQSNLTVDFGLVRAPVLAFTGADVDGALRTVALLMALGGLFVVGARRKRS